MPSKRKDDQLQHEASQNRYFTVYAIHSPHRTVDTMSATSPLKAAERKFRILIADDHPLIRKTVRAVLEEDPRFEVCGEAFNGAAAIEEAGRLMGSKRRGLLSQRFRNR